MGTSMPNLNYYALIGGTWRQVEITPVDDFGDSHTVEPVNLTDGIDWELAGELRYRQQAEQPPSRTGGDNEIEAQKTRA